MNTRTKVILIKGFLFLVSIFSCTVLFSQQKQSGKDNAYYVISPHQRFIEYNEKEDKLGRVKKVVYKTKFDILSKITIGDKEYYVLDFWDITDKLNDGDPYVLNNKDNNKSFLLEVEKFDSMVESNLITTEYKFFLLHPVIYGLNISLPFKIRPKIDDDNFKLNPEFQLGGYFGFQFRLSHTKPYYLSFPVVTGGLSSIQVNESTLEPGNKDGILVGLTGSYGTIIQLDDFQIGFMMGWDFVPGQAGEQWRYNELPWYSFGVGYSFLGGNNENEKKEEKKEKNLTENLRPESIESLRRQDIVSRAENYINSTPINNTDVRGVGSANSGAPGNTETPDNTGTPANNANNGTPVNELEQ